MKPSENQPFKFISQKDTPKLEFLKGDTSTLEWFWHAITFWNENQKHELFFVRGNFYVNITLWKFDIRRIKNARKSKKYGKPWKYA